MNLRLLVFLPLFGLACAASLAWVYSRPAVYVSTARLQIEQVTGGASLPGDAASGQPGIVQAPPALVSAVQAMTGSEVLDKIVASFAASASGAIGSSDALRGMLGAAPVAGTNVIELRAEGSARELLPAILERWIDVFRQVQSEAHVQGSVVALDEARRTVGEMEERVAARRREAEALRKRSDIVSAESGDNQAMARLRSLSAALNEARTKEVNAEARLNAMQESAASGKPVLATRARGVIDDLHRRAADLREKMKDAESDFTPQYLAFDNRYKAMRANLTRIEEQIEREQQSGAKLALREAEEELAGARKAVAKLQEELGTRKQEAQAFSARMAEYSAVAGGLGKLEESVALARNNLAQLEAAHGRAAPKMTVLSQPSVPERPLRPDYDRDALIGVAASAALGFLAILLVEFFRRSGMPQAAPAAPQVMQPVIQIAITREMLAGSHAPALAGSAQVVAIEGDRQRLIEHAAQLPRELSTPEVHALWSAAAPDSRLIVAGLLSGMTSADLRALRFALVDFGAGCVCSPDQAARSLPLHEPLRGLLERRRKSSDGELALSGADGAPLSAEDLDGLIACAASDAGLSYPAAVNAAVLRHTYVAQLLRQGARLADLGALLDGGRPAALREYSRLSPPGPKLAFEQIDPVHPVLRRQTI